VALIVIGPEKLPRVARTVGTLLGKAQRYVSDVKAEVSRSMELDELKKMKDTVESVRADVEQSIQTNASDFEKVLGRNHRMATTRSPPAWATALSYPAYRHPGKRWRVKQGAMPNWYKARTGVRTRALSGAARVARLPARKRSTDRLTGPPCRPGARLPAGIPMTR
jgi:sec-independent protein translocase protein TatB